MPTNNNQHKRQRFGAAIALCVGLGAAMPASAGFVPYVIRNAGVVSPGINVGVTETEFVITLGGQKAALGSTDIDGSTIGSITQLAIERLDDATRFSAGSGPAVAPYLNFWITDGLGNYAVAANEPSNPDFQPLYNNGYDLDFADLSDKVVKFYENSDLSWLPTSGVGLTFADIANFVIQAPTVAELGIGWAGLGSGAPRELGTNVAYGVNWVFGDTLTNYLSGDDGYRVANALVTAAASVPEPTSLALCALALVGVARRRVNA